MLKIKHLGRALAYQAWQSGEMKPAFQASVADIRVKRHPDGSYTGYYPNEEPKQIQDQPKPEI